jgi:cobalamin synthase
MIMPWLVRGALGGAALILAFVAAYMAATWPPDSSWHIVIIGGWAVIPPLYIFCAYTLATWRGVPPPGLSTQAFDHYKHQHQLAAAIWAAVLVCLFAIYQHRDWLNEVAPASPRAHELSTTALRLPVSSYQHKSCGKSPDGAR